MTHFGQLHVQRSSALEVRAPGAASNVDIAKSLFWQASAMLGVRELMVQPSSSLIEKMQLDFDT